MAAKEKETADGKKRNDRKKRAAASTTAQPNSLGRFLRETRGEMRKVVWPTREESWRLTLIVLGVTVLFAIFLGLLDAVFSSAFELLVDLLTA